MYICVYIHICIYYMYYIRIIFIFICIMYYVLCIMYYVCTINAHLRTVVVTNCDVFAVKCSLGDKYLTYII